MTDQTIHIFLNGETNSPETFFDFYEPGDSIIAVDGGLRYLQAINVKPDLLVGDLDSVDDKHLKDMANEKVKIIKFSPHKDETDFELALNEASKFSYRKIRVYGGLGGRLDHTLVNLSVCASERYIGVEIIFTEANQEVFFLIKKHTIKGKTGDLVSLIPWGGDVTGINTKGLEYPLQQETLRFDGSRGISNIMMADIAEVVFESGRLLCVHQKPS